MFGIGFSELILILVVALVVFGPDKLPEIGKTLGKTVKEFNRAVNKIDSQIKNEVNNVAETAGMERYERDGEKSRRVIKKFWQRIKRYEQN